MMYICYFYFYPNYLSSYSWSREGSLTCLAVPFSPSTNNSLEAKQLHFKSSYTKWQKLTLVGLIRSVKQQLKDDSLVLTSENASNRSRQCFQEDFTLNTTPKFWKKATSYYFEYLSKLKKLTRVMVANKTVFVIPSRGYVETAKPDEVKDVHNPQLQGQVFISVSVSIIMSLLSLL